MIHFFKYILPYWGKLSVSIFSNIFSTLFSLFSITMIIPFLNILFKKQEMVYESVPFEFSVEALKTNFYYLLSKIITERGGEAALLFVSVVVVVMVLFKSGFMYTARYTMASMKFNIIRDIRNTLYHKIIYLPLSFFSEEKKGDIISRMSGDIQQVQMFLVRSIHTLIKNPIMIIVYMYSLFFMSTQLTLFVLAVLPVAGFTIGCIGKTLRSKSLKGQRILGVVISYIEETMFGIRIIKAFNSEKHSIRHFRKNNYMFTRLMKKVERRRVLAHPVSELLGTIVIVMIMYFGGKIVLSGTGTLTPGALIGYLVIFSQVLNPSKGLSTLYYDIQKGIASYDRIREILDMDNPIKDKPDAQAITEFQHTIQYDSVYFRYTDTDVLKNITFEITKGQTIALVGPSGAGKSTLADLLPRFYDVTQGTIYIDGVPLQHFKKHAVREMIGIVSQEAILFNETVYNNIAFGRANVTESEVIEAAKVANAHDFIVQMAQGYQTNVGDRGIKLSGGQRQRITIARAILNNPPILIMDEATSSLDSESEKLVQNAIFNLMEHRTSIVIAHRLSTIMKADMILVMQDGEIIERGKYQELLDKNGLFTKLHNKQFD
jgi:subfamily B ATP-binding cassette protein MsbA